MTDKEIMQMALDALESWQKTCLDCGRPSEELGRSTKPLQALRTALAQPDTQIGITYEEANSPEPYCKRCGKKLGTEAYDVHTCTPKEIQPVAWCIVKDGRVHGLVKFKPAVMNSEKWQPLYTEPQKKEWVGLTGDEVNECAAGCHNGNSVQDAIQKAEAKLKDKNT